MSLSSRSCFRRATVRNRSCFAAGRLPRGGCFAASRPVGEPEKTKRKLVRSEQAATRRATQSYLRFGALSYLWPADRPPRRRPPRRRSRPALPAGGTPLPVSFAPVPHTVAADRREGRRTSLRSRCSHCPARPHFPTFEQLGSLRRSARATLRIRRSVRTSCITSRLDASCRSTSEQSLTHCSPTVRA